MHTRALTFALAISLSGAAMTPAFATDADQRTVAVRHSDLDLATEDGLAELDRRIDRAAEQACGLDETTIGTRVRSREARNCYRQTRSQLERQFAQVISDAQRGG